MKLFVLLLTIMFCFSVIGSKNLVSFQQDIERSENDDEKKFQLQLIPIVHNFISIPEVAFAFVYPTHDFTISFHPSITSEICSQGPPLV